MSGDDDETSSLLDNSRNYFSGIESKRKRLFMLLFSVFILIIVGLFIVFILTVVDSQIDDASISKLKSKVNILESTLKNDTELCTNRLDSLSNHLNVLTTLLEVTNTNYTYDANTSCWQTQIMYDTVSDAIEKVNATKQHSDPAWDGCIFTSNEILNIRNIYYDIKNQIYGDLSLIQWADDERWNGYTPSLPAYLKDSCVICDNVTSLLDRIENADGNVFELGELILLEAELQHWHLLLDTGYAHILYGDCATSIAPMCHPVILFYWNMEIIYPLLPNSALEEKILNYFITHMDTLKNWTEFYDSLILTSAKNVHANSTVTEWNTSFIKALQYNVSTKICLLMTDDNKQSCINLSQYIENVHNDFRSKWDQYIQYCSQTRPNSDLSLPLSVYSIFSNDKKIDTYMTYAINNSDVSISMIDLLMSSLFNMTFNEFAAESLNPDNLDYFIVGGNNKCTASFLGNTQCDAEVVAEAWRIYGSYSTLPLRGSGSIFFGSNGYDVSYQVDGEYDIMGRQWIMPTRIIIGYDAINSGGDHVYYWPSLNSYIVKEIAYAALSQLSTNIQCKLSNWTNPEWISVSLLAQTLNIGLDGTGIQYDENIMKVTSMQYVGYYVNQLLYSTMIYMDIALNTGIASYSDCISIFRQRGFIKSDQYCLSIVSNPGYALWYRAIEGDINTLADYLNDL